MKVFARMLDRDGTEHEVEIGDADDVSADHHYVHEHVKMNSGDLAFVEVSKDRTEWIVWRVMNVWPGGYVSASVTHEEARAELRRIAEKK